MKLKPLWAWVAWGLWSFFLAAMLSAYALAFIVKDPEQLRIDSFGLGLGFLVFATVGALIVSRRANHPIGWLCLATALFASFTLLGNEYLTLTKTTHLPFRTAVAWADSWTWYLAVGAAFLVLPLFPNGRTLSRRWRVVFLSLVTAIVIFTISGMLKPGPLDAEESISNPLGVPLLASIQKYGDPLVSGLLVFGLVGSLVQIVVRFRRARGETRLQLKWFSYTSVMVVALNLIEVPFDEVLSHSVGNILFAVGLLAVPVSIGVALLKYRLYDIDVVINKTVVYGALAAFITLVYVGVVVGIGALVGAGGRPNLALSLAATAIVAVAFQPVRERVQRFANKLVYGERVTPYEAVTSFSHRMSASLSLESVLPEMAEAAAKGVGGTRSRVKLFLPGGGQQVVTWPVDSSADSFDRTLKVTHQGEEVGELAVAKAPGEQITKGEDKLLSDLVSQAGLAMRNLRLTGELQNKLVELQESRKRIVAAQDEERRRMERDIHDGAQQQLVAMAVELGMAESLLSDSAKASELLDQLIKDADGTVETLRDLARGLFPQILGERGLVAGVESHAQKSGSRARVIDEIGGARFDLEVEVNVYFVIREALQNASKHAPGAPITITLAERGGLLDFSVKDEGPGFDANKVRLGSGLQNMADRVEALGGAFEIDSSPGTGTKLTGHIPAHELAGPRR